MPQSPTLGVAAQPAIPITGSTIGSDPTVTGIPGAPSDVEAALTILYALIAALDQVVLQDEDGTPQGPATSVSVPNGSLDLVGTAAHLNYVPSRGGTRQIMVTDASVAGTYTIDWSVANSWDLTLTGDTTISFSNIPADDGSDYHVNLVLRQGGTGSYTVVWPAAVKWQSATGTNTGSAPTLWTAVEAQDDFEFSTADGGTTVGGTMTSHPTGFTAGGDLTGTSTSQTVAKINGSALGTTSGASVGDRLRWDGSGWTKSSLIWRPVTVYDGTNWLPLVDGSGNAIMVEA